MALQRSHSYSILEFLVETGNAHVQLIEVFPLEQVREAYEKMMAAKTHFRAVLKTRVRLIPRDTERPADMRRKNYKEMGK